MSKTSDEPARRFVGVIDDLSTHLRQLREEGVESLEADPTLMENPVPIPSARPSSSLDAVAQRVAACRLCRLCETRTRTVPGQGPSRPELVFVGEGPGADEDAQGLAFVGRAGQLLTKIIRAMGFERDEVWIGNIVKCRPPGNRVPSPDEMEACLPYLREQIGLLRPKVMVCLGATAVKGLLDAQQGITKLRGRWMSFEGIDVMPTYHPAYLLRNPKAKREVWQDMQSVLERLGRPVPSRDQNLINRRPD